MKVSERDRDWKVIGRFGLERVRWGLYRKKRNGKEWCVRSMINHDKVSGSRIISIMAFASQMIPNSASLSSLYIYINHG